MRLVFVIASVSAIRYGEIASAQRPRNDTVNGYIIYILGLLFATITGSLLPGLTMCTAHDRHGSNE